MDSKSRLLRYLPSFLKRKRAGQADHIATAVAAGADELLLDIQELRARGAGNRFLDEFGGYYISERRHHDVARIGLSRFLSKRENETWDEFESRVRDFIGLETWDGVCQRFTVTSDVAQWGCMTGIERELERTGLDAVLTSAAEDHERWIVLSLGHLPPPDPLDESMLYAIDTPPVPAQRQTKLYEADGDPWTLWITLTNPNPVSYLEDELLEIVKLTKPAWVRAWVLFPEAPNWVRVD